MKARYLGETDPIGLKKGRIYQMILLGNCTLNANKYMAMKIKT